MADPSFQTFALLMDWLLKGFLILGCTFAADAVFRRASASLLHLLWLVSLSSAILLPLLSTAVPALNLPILQMGDLTGRPQISSDFASTGTGGGHSVSQILIAVYLSGVIVVLAWQVVGRAYVARLRRKSKPVSHAGLLRELRRLRELLGVGKEVSLLSSHEATIPFSTGVIRPAIVFPSNWRSWGASMIDAVLMHELGHIRRKDCLTRIISQLGCCLHWINPLAWIAMGRIIMEQEIACDSLVLENGAKPSVYARDLLSLAKVRSGQVHFAMTPLGRRTELRSRLLEILKPRRSRTRLPFSSSLAFAACSLILLLPIASLNLWKYPEAQAAGGRFSDPSPLPTKPEAVTPTPDRKETIPPQAALPDPELFKETITRQIAQMKAEGAPEQKIAEYTKKAKAKLADLQKMKQAEAASKEKSKSPRSK